jgi:hypothetical protein
LGVWTVQLPLGEARPVGLTLHVTRRPDLVRPAHVHDAAPRGAQLTDSIVNPCVRAIARA